MACIFGKGGRPAQPKPGNLRCSWCDPEHLVEVCDKEQGRRRLQQLYKAFSPAVAAEARNRLRPRVRWGFPMPGPDAPAAAEKAALPEEAVQPAEDEARPAEEPFQWPQNQVAEDGPRHGPVRPATHVDLSRSADFAEAEAVLAAHATAVHALLQPRWIAGDGNCLYRAVATQLPQGVEYHAGFRQLSTAAAVSMRLHYALQTPEAVCAWAESMQRLGHWADHISCRGLTDFLSHPLVIWCI